MKKFFCSIVLAFTLVSCAEKNPYAQTPNTQSDYAIVPLPQKMEIQNGRFLLNDKTEIIYKDNLSKEADLLKEYIKLQTGISVTLSQNEKKTNSITLLLDTSITEEEGYLIKVTPETILLSAKTSTGVFLATQTLRQLIIEAQTDNKKDYVIPSTTIKDAPLFAYRGMHLDVGRHMFPIEFIKKYIDLLALHKMNRFHWHLTEDQGWRIEIKKYPKLTEVGAWRSQTAIGKNFPYAYEGATFKGDGQSYGGFYTQAEAREIVQYAADRHITVIPEIDMPGHMLAALASYPEFNHNTNTKTKKKNSQ